MWFPIDVLTTIPFDSVFEFIGGGGGSGGDGDARGGGGAVRLIKVGKGLKAMKMLRLNKLMRGAALEVYEDIMATSSSARFLLKMLKMLFLMGFIFHWTACLWHLIALNEKSRDNWVDSYFGDDSVEFEDDGDVLLVEDLPLGKRYLAAVYFAVTTMTTVGYGDITPASNSERVFCFFAMIVGGTFYGFLIGNMSSIVADVDSASREYNTRMERIFSYMQKRNFPPELQRKVKRFFRVLFRETSALDDSDVLHGLSSKLKGEVALHLVNGIVAQHPGFDGLPGHFLSMLSSIIYPLFYLDEEEIVSKGEEIVELFIIVDGNAAATFPAVAHGPDDSHATQRLLQLHKGNSFGEEALLEEDDAVTHYWPVAVFALGGPCECTVIALDDLRDRFGAEMETVREQVRGAIALGTLRLISRMEGTREVKRKRTSVVMNHKPHDAQKGEEKKQTPLELLPGDLDMQIDDIAPGPGTSTRVRRPASTPCVTRAPTDKKLPVLLNEPAYDEDADAQSIHGDDDEPEHRQGTETSSITVGDDEHTPDTQVGQAQLSALSARMEQLDKRVARNMHTLVEGQKSLAMAIERLSVQFQGGHGPRHSFSQQSAMPLNDRQTTRERRKSRTILQHQGSAVYHVQQSSSRQMHMSSSTQRTGISQA